MSCDADCRLRRPRVLARCGASGSPWCHGETVLPRGEASWRGLPLSYPGSSSERTGGRSFADLGDAMKLDLPTVLPYALAGGVVLFVLSRRGKAFSGPSTPGVPTGAANPNLETILPGTAQRPAGAPIWRWYMQPVIPSQSAPPPDSRRPMSSVLVPIPSSGPSPFGP